MPEQQLNALLQQVQALTQGQEQQNAALQQMRQEKEALRAELSVAVARQGELSQELVKAQGALIATQQAVSAVAGADGTIRAAGSSAGYVKHVDVLKAVKQPQSLKEKDQWERFGFQVDAYKPVPKHLVFSFVFGSLKACFCFFGKKWFSRFLGQILMF